MMSSKGPKVSIRRAGSSDIPRVADLIKVFEHNYTVETVREIVSDLAPDKYYGWLAFAGDEAVGVTTLEACILECNVRQCRAGYWSHLTVRPDYRKTTVYPRLFFTMLSEAADAGIEVVYAAIRRPEVAAGHLAIGMEKIGEIPVLARPLRPARLLSKYLRLGSLAGQLSAIPDYAYRGYLSAHRSLVRRDYFVRDTLVRDADHHALLPVLRELHMSELQRPLTVESLAKRYNTSHDGDDYRVMCIEKSGELRAGIIYRKAVRDNIHTMVIMEAGYKVPDRDALRFGLAALEKQAMALKCEVILCLSSSASIQILLKRSGYFRSNETYVLMKKPTSPKFHCALPEQLDGWYFTFGDHNAF